MDSLTQMVLGAAVGEACLGKKAGKRAALWGAIGGTIPDLDIISSFFQGEFEYLIAHRGFTHSLTFCVLAAPLLGWLIYRIYGEKWGSMRQWSLLAFWAFLTHALLDCCTSWGTQLFYPFSDYRVAWNNIFVADPLYTLPFLLCVLISLFLHRQSSWRVFWNRAGLFISSFYLLLTFVNKATVNAVFEQAYLQQGKSVLRCSTFPTPLNNILWYAVAETPSTYEIGYYSLLADNRNIQFISIPKNHKPIAHAREQYVIDRLIWLSKGYFTLTEEEDGLYWHDLRFGLMNLWEADVAGPQYVFSFRLLRQGDTFVGIASEGPPRPEDFKREDLQRFWEKIWGK